MNNIFKVSGVILLVFFIHSCKNDNPTIPVLTTTAVSGVTATMAISGGTISSDGGAQVIASGVCWGTGVEPTTSDSKTSDVPMSGSFVSNITGLEGGTIYYVRAYGTNSAGTGYVKAQGTENEYKRIHHQQLSLF